MDSPVRVFLSCGDVVQGSYFEVLFHQLTDGAVPKMATDRSFLVGPTQKVRVSLTTDSGLAHYPARLNDMYKQADVIVLVYSLVERASFEGLQDKYDLITGPVRDFVPATFVLLGMIPPGCSDKTPLVSPQEVESLVSQFGASKYELDASIARREADDFWTFVAKSHLSSAKAITPSKAIVMLKSEVLIPLATNLITRMDQSDTLLAAMEQLNPKKTEKLFKAAVKATGKRESFTLHPSRAEILNATLLTPTFFTFTITNTTKGPVNWSIPDPDRVTPQYFFSCSESSGSLGKGKSTTVTMTCVFYAPAEMSRFILVECSQDPGLFAPIYVRCCAPLQQRDLTATWNIDRKAISIGFRISSTKSANVYRSTLYGAVVAVKEWMRGYDGKIPKDFHVEWETFSKLKHPNIAQFLGGSQEASSSSPFHAAPHSSNASSTSPQTPQQHLQLQPQNPFIVLEYLKHGQLGNFLYNPPPRGIVRTIDLRLKMASDLAKAMAYLHSQKMLHRDLTSANVLVDADCSVKLGDFGEARTSEALRHTLPSEALNLDWTAPELLGEGVHSQKSDVFSFGIILWEFGAERAPQRTLLDVKNGLLPGLPMEVKTRYPAFGELVSACTSVDPNARPSFDEIVEKLENIRQTGPVAYTATPVAKNPVKQEPPRYIAPAHAVPPKMMMPPQPRKELVTVELSLGPSTLNQLEQQGASPQLAQPLVPITMSPTTPAGGAPQRSQSPPPPDAITALASPRSASGPGGIAPKSPTVSPRSPLTSAPDLLVSPRPQPIVANANGALLPSAVPLVAPTAGGRMPANSFVLPSAPAPPPLAASAPNTTLNLSSPLLRMPSMSQYGAPMPMSPTNGAMAANAKSPRVGAQIPLAGLNAPVPPPLSPVAGATGSFSPLLTPTPPMTMPVPTQAQGPVQHNAKLDNLMDWADDVYSTFSTPDTKPMSPAMAAATSPRATHVDPRLAPTAGAAKPEFSDSPFDSPFDAL